METNALILSVFFGAVGMGMFLYGKKEGRVPPLVAGLGLMVFPYLVPNLIGMAIVGALLIASPMALAKI